MAGHSKFKNIQHRKNAQDQKRSKILTKLQREVYMAARSGLPDPDLNSRLKVAIEKAKAQNASKDLIKSAIEKAKGSTDGSGFEDIRYDGYGVDGMSIIVEATTDNKNRTAGEVRSLFTKHGGTLVATGSLDFCFEHKGYVVYNKQQININFDDLFEFSIDVGADDVEDIEESYVISSDFDKFKKMEDSFIEKFGVPSESDIEWFPTTPKDISEDKIETMTKLIDALEELDDVSGVYHTASNL
jgi:YebC/PmpR family DNA-binding regulatory protein